MSFDVSKEDTKIEVVHEVDVDECTVEPPIEEWSSLVINIEQNQKLALYDQGIYSPGSGEICNKYEAMSASSIFRHPYYNYPAVIDPGIKEALLDPEPKVMYPDDGQDLYLALCKEMKQNPVISFYKGLLTESIDLRYYGINPSGVRAMALSLQYNSNVTIFNLKDNFLSDDACLHLGLMLTNNSNLQELDLTGCKIGPSGAKRLFTGLHHNISLKILILDKNEIGDIGIEYFANTIFRSVNLKQISLSYNNITGRSASVLAKALETCNKFTHINLSWNHLCGPISGTINLFNRLSENKNLQELNLSWNSLSHPRIGDALKNIFKSSNLRLLDLSNNRLSGEAIQNLIVNMSKAKTMVTLDLSYNPMTPEDALKVLFKMKSNAVNIKNILMENVFVTGAFLRHLKLVMAMPIRKNTVITYGGVIGGFVTTGPDIRDIVLNRVEYLTKIKKRKVDIALIVLQLKKDGIDIMPAKNFADALLMSGVPLDNDLIDEIVNAFPGPKRGKTKSISINLLADYIHQKWPDRKLPPTPPPELILEPQPAEVQPEPVKQKATKRKK